mgnify:CR=1 FL=1
MYSSKRKGKTLAHFPKPAEGSWTEHWPELGTAPVDYTDSIDPEQWKAEQQAIFRKPLIRWVQPLGKHSLVGKLPLPIPATSIPFSKSLHSFKVRTSMHFCSLFSSRPVAKSLGCKLPR